MTEVSIGSERHPVNHSDYVNPWRLFRGSLVPEWLEVRTDVGPAAKLVYARLMRYAGRCGVAWPTREKLAESLGLSVRAVCDALKELRSAELIETRKVSFAGGNEYRFLAHHWMLADVRPEDAEAEAANEANFASLDAQSGEICPPMRQNLPSNEAEFASLEWHVTDSRESSKPQKNGSEENHRRESQNIIINVDHKFQAQQEVRRRGRKPDEKGSQAKELLDRAVQACERYGRPKFPVRGAAAIKSLKLLISTYGFDLAKEIVDAFYRDTPRWNLETGRMAPEHIVLAAQRILARPRGILDGHKTPTGAGVTQYTETIEDSVDTDEEGRRRSVRIWRDANGQELRRRWGKVLE